jgi:hypothetical protein
MLGDTKNALGFLAIRTRIDENQAQQREALNAIDRFGGLSFSALRAVAVGCDRPEYGPITTDRALHLPEGFGGDAICNGRS